MNKNKNLLSHMSPISINAPNHKRSVSDLKTRWEVHELLLTELRWLLDTRISDDRVEFNEETQKTIEFMCFKTVDEINYNSLNGVDKRVLNSKTGSYLLDKTQSIDSKILDLRKHLHEMHNIKDCSNEYYTFILLDVLDNNNIRNIIYYIYHVVLSNQNTDSLEENCSLVRLVITIGKLLVRTHLVLVCNRYRLDYNTKILFSDWKDIFDVDCTDISKTYADDRFLAFAGSKIVEVMESVGLVYKDLLKTKLKENKYVLRISDEKILSLATRTITYPPTKLPMVVEPQKYIHKKGKGYQGGYLLNEDFYSQELIIEKAAYKLPSMITNIENSIFDMVHGIDSTPFKVNKELLQFVLSNRKEMLLEEKHPFESVINKTKYHKDKIKSHNSKVVLQNTILSIAQTFEYVPQIYFPVRLDSRGRLYCDPQYFNYQSSELARALILFAKPSIISRKDIENTESCVKYLQISGANYYGHDKRSIQYKLNWVKSHEYEIINYDKSGIISNAKEKLLFLSFCIEYTKFVEFRRDNTLLEYKTYLPIQLDATCNGFQHMALLSYETELFTHLNLTRSNKSSKGESNDFYTFVLHRVKKTLLDMSYSSESENTKKSVMRLEKFDLNRGMIKKCIMTIPYNSSHQKRKEYMENSLVREEEWDKENQVYWYHDTNHVKNKVNTKDLDLLTSIIKRVIEHDHEKIRKLSKYLKNIANLFVKLELPIGWHTPTGLDVIQSYLGKKSTSISPFQHSRIKLSLNVTLETFDKNKQIRSLMPNLIHSLDASSLCMLYNEFSRVFNKPQFYSVHDCFATTFDKADQLKSLLASIYTDLYIDNRYLEKFDKGILEQLKTIGKCEISSDRIITLPDKTKYQLHNIDWVLNKKSLTKSQEFKIDSQFILI